MPVVGNGFIICAHEIETINNDYLVDSGLTLSIPHHLKLEIEPLPGFLIQSFSMKLSFEDLIESNDITDSRYGRLMLQVTGSLDEGMGIARGWIVNRNVCEVRFIDTSTSGGRKIVGDPENASTC